MSKLIEKLDKKSALESSLFKLVQEQPFYGALLQEINIQYNKQIPTAGILYNKKKDAIEMHLNEDFFCTRPMDERKAILFHEMLHFSHQHIWRYMEKKTSDSQQMLFNIAADMSINQYIQGLSESAINVDNYKLDDGKPFPKFKTMEFYWDLLEKNDGKEAKQKAEKKGKKTPNEDELGKYSTNPYDSHDWEELSENEKQKLLEEAKKVIKRTIDKSQFGHSIVPDSVKDLLEEIDAQIQGINYKQILRSIIRKTLCSNDRETTWNKPSKRFGIYAKGTTIGHIPNILFLVDSSGSISHTELQEFFKIVDGFLKIGQKTCKVGFWHTQLYKVKKY